MGQAFNPDKHYPSQDPQAMAARLMEFAPATDSEALKLLRASFPDCPLSLRVAALGFLMKKSRPHAGASRSPLYIPK